jgi:hypothetical protein
LIYFYLKNKTAQIAKQNIIKYDFPDMNSEIILETFEKRLLMQRYAGNTIRSYKDYASIFLKHVSKYPSLEEIHQSKGKKDRIVSLPDKLLATLRHYYQAFKPKEYLFEGEKDGKYRQG